MEQKELNKSSKFLHLLGRKTFIMHLQNTGTAENVLHCFRWRPEQPVLASSIHDFTPGGGRRTFVTARDCEEEGGMVACDVTLE